ncbi:hypothetical protein [Tropicimonas sp. IMCC34043]|uniref:hypothetical protein n=1 Tax=Tropicimonas sp. IMCC34043 TaxID=2248760 RepID=UPI000E2693AB|nr:hypothetical protein [Tropicimonas sp. IMCC34043]
MIDRLIQDMIMMLDQFVTNVGAGRMGAAEWGVLLGMALFTAGTVVVGVIMRGAISETPED